MRRALAVALDAGPDEQAGRAYANLHALLDGERRFAEADRVFAEGVAYCDEHDVGTFATCLRGERTVWLDRVGRWDEARAAGERAARPFRSLPRQPAQPAARPGPRPRPARPVRRLAAAGRGRGAGGRDGGARVDRPRAAGPRRGGLARGRADAATAELAHAAAVAGSCDGWVQGAVAAWQRRLGLPVDAPARVEEPWALQLAARPLEAAAAWDAVGCPYEAALARMDSDDEQALRAALRGLDRLGAVAAAQAVRRRMRRPGISSVPAGPRAATRSSRFGLTRREQEVLGLVAAGLPNSDISRRLFISERTVDHHVTAVLAKMGVRSRGLAAREAHRLGLVDQPEPRRPRDGEVAHTA